MRGRLARFTFTTTVPRLMQGVAVLLQTGWAADKNTQTYFSRDAKPGVAIIESMESSRQARYACEFR